MPLKLKKSQASIESRSEKDELSGPWGQINPEPQSAVVLRLCKKASVSTEESHSYPYRALSCWHWHGGNIHEKLEIEAGSDLVTVTGRGLERLAKALDRSALEILREHPDSSPESPIVVEAISLISERRLQLGS